MTETSPITPLHVVIVGGGIAALETVLALHDLGEARLRLTLIAPEPEFTMPPMAVAVPFSRGHSDGLALADVMAEHRGHFVRGAAQRIDAGARTVVLTTGDEITYDVLVLALGASAVPAYTHALTFGTHPTALNGILADLEEGWSRSVAFVVPRGCTWPLPIYELALMTAHDVWSMNADHVELHLVTPELQPLALFGPKASAAVAELLAEANVTVHHGVRARMEDSTHIITGTGPDIAVNRVVALPLLEGPRLDGIPSSADGFIPVNDVGEVAGLDCVYAVGDASDRPIKQGGLACQQADVTAAHIAVRAGADIEVPPLEQVLRGRLLTGTHDRYLRRGLTARADDVTDDEPAWWAPTKVSGKYLSPYLVSKDVVHLTTRAARPLAGIDVHVALSDAVAAARASL